MAKISKRVKRRIADDTARWRLVFRRFIKAYNKAAEAGPSEA